MIHQIVVQCLIWGRNFTKNKLDLIRKNPQQLCENMGMKKYIIILIIASRLANPKLKIELLTFYSLKISEKYV